MKAMEVVKWSAKSVEAAPKKNLYVFEDTRSIANCFGVIARDEIGAYAHLVKMNCRQEDNKIIFQLPVSSGEEAEGVVFMVEE